VAALAIDGLSVDLGGRPAIEAVDLDVAAGELVGLIGPNGAGKTTLLRAVLGLVAPRSGTIAVDGDRRTVGYVPQRHAFAWDYPISVARAVLSARAGLVGRLRRTQASDRAAAQDALARVDMLAQRDRPLGELSGGQRQRVLVARALALRPRLLLLDEPFTGLDVPTQDLLTGLLRELRAQGAAVLMTTHDLPGAATLCDRLCLLNRTVVADGPPADLRDPAIWLRAFGVAQSERTLDWFGAVR
jgi:manganese/iron transport system ATP-binding protein